MKKMWKKLLAGAMAAGILTSSVAISASAATMEDNTAFSGGAESVGAAQTDIATCYVSVTLNSYEYDGTRKVPTVVVMDGTKTLQNGTDYTLGGPPIYFGNQPVIVYGKGNYTGSVTKYVTVTKSIDKCDVTVTLNSYVYDGTRKTGTVVVKDGNKTLVCGTDYTIGGPPIFSGTQPVIVYGKGNYTGNVTKYVTVAKSIEQCDVTVTLDSYEYDGTRKVPTVVVKDGTKTLQNGTDYTIGGPPIYSGTQPVAIYGKGNYTGNVTKYVTVTKSIEQCDVTVTLNSYVYDGTDKTLTVVVKDGAQTLTQGTDYTISASPHICSGTQPVFVYGQGKYRDSVKKTVTIQPVSVSASDITIIPSEVIGYLDPASGKVRNAVSVAVNFNGKTHHLTNGAGYTVSYSDYRSGMVSAQVTLKGGFDGFFSTDKFYPTEPAFVWGQDNFSFGNGGNATGQNYSVDEPVFNALAEKFHLTETEKTALRNQIAADNKGGMKGRCNGMATGCILSKTGRLKFSEFIENDAALSNYAYENGEERTMVSIINFLQEMWSSVNYRKVEVEARSLVTQNPDKIKQMQGTYIKRIVDELESNHSLLKLSYMTSDKNSHALTAYGVEPFEYHSDTTGRDYNYRVLLYDPNRLPGTNSLYAETCIYVYKPASGNENDYYYEMSNTGYYWNTSGTNCGGIFGAYKLYSLTDEYNILNTRYSKCFVEAEDGAVTYDYRVVVPSGGKRVLIGDANLDGRVDITDCTLIQRYLISIADMTDLQLVNADANLDGVISVKDVTYLQRKIAGLCD